MGKESIQVSGDGAPSGKVVISRELWIATLLVASQSFLYGYVMVALNPCMVTGKGNSGSACFSNDDNNPDGHCPPGTLYNDLDLSTIESSLTNAVFVIGAWIGSLVGSHPSELYGRRRSLLYNTIFFVIGGLLSASGNKIALFLGRVVSGFGVGVVSCLAPVLLSEIASIDTRGTVTTMHQTMLTLGILIVSLLGFGFVQYVNHGWQYVQAFQIIPCMLLWIFQKYVPESPKWLVRQNRSGEAKEVLEHLRPVGYNLDEEIQGIINEEKSGSVEDPTWSEVFASKGAVLIGCGLMFFQAFSGINTVMFYSTTIFGFAGFDSPIIATASVGTANFLMTIFATYLVDRVGRKILLVGGMYIMLGALALLSSILLAYNSNTTAQGVIAVVAVLIYVIGFAVGLGAVCWVIMTEVIPNRLRVKAISLFLNLSWLCNLVISLVTLTAIDLLGGVKNSMDDDEKSDAQKLGVSYLYFIFLAIMGVAIVFVHLFVPETKGKSHEEIHGSATSPLLAEEYYDDPRKV